MDRQQTRLSALRCGNKKQNTCMAATLLRPLCSPFSSFPSPFTHPLFLPLSVWFRNCSICHLGFGILPSPATSQTRRPLCCFMLSMFPSHPDSSPASAPVLSCTSTLGIVGSWHLNCGRSVHAFEYLLHKVKPPLRLSEGSAGDVF